MDTGKKQNDEEKNHIFVLEEMSHATESSIKSSKWLFGYKKGFLSECFQ